MAAIGIGPAYMKERHGSTFTAECHVRYLREMHLGDPVQVTVYLLAADEKRLHTFEELRHATEGWISATSENMTLHVDMNARKVAPFPPDIRARIQAIADIHAGCRVPRAPAARWRCPRSNAKARLKPRTPARQSHHGRDQEQDDGDEEDHLGDFDRGAGDAAEAQNARDQRDDQKRNDPAST